MMIKQHGPEDFSSSNCQVPPSYQELCSLSHPDYFSFYFLSHLEAGGCTQMGNGRGYSIPAARKPQASLFGDSRAATPSLLGLAHLLDRSPGAPMGDRAAGLDVATVLCW